MEWCGRKRSEYERKARIAIHLLTVDLVEASALEYSRHLDGDEVWTARHLVGIGWKVQVVSNQVKIGFLSMEKTCL